MVIEPTEKVVEVEPVPPVTVETKPVKDYVFPKPSTQQAKNLKPGGEAPTRVVKITYANEDERFWYDKGVKTVHIGQYRIPMSNNKFDLERLWMELRRNNLVLVEEAFPNEVNHYCELNECWKPAYADGAFCTASHRNLALAGHNRMWVFE